MIPRVATALLWAVLVAPLAAQQNTAGTRALDAKTALGLSQAAIGRDVGEHQLLDTDGRSVRLADFRGKPLLVSFIYTGCFQVCPTTTKSLAEAVEQLSQVFGADKYKVVSIGFNQPADSPEAMRAFAAQMRIKEPNWKFLSAPPATVDALTRAFGFSYVATPAGFDHLLAVTVVDTQSRIYAQVFGERFSRDQLGEPMRLLLRDQPMPPGLPLTELIDRVRILCTIYDPLTGEYRTNYGLVLEIAGGITFALTMAWFFLAEWRNRRRARRDALRASGQLTETSR
jgi:protein SCO1/2